MKRKDALRFFFFYLPCKESVKSLAATKKEFRHLAVLYKLLRMAAFTGIEACLTNLTLRVPEKGQRFYSFLFNRSMLDEIHYTHKWHKNRVCPMFCIESNKFRPSQFCCPDRATSRALATTRRRLN